MDEEITYYEINIADGSRDNPVGLARCRRLADGGIEYELLRHDMSWWPDSLIVEWRRGDAVEELVEISAGEAEALIERFRQKWRHQP
jgi:hypothetical protein